MLFRSLDPEVYQNIIFLITLLHKINSFSTRKKKLKLQFFRV